MTKITEFSDLLGKICTSVTKSDDDGEICFTLDDGRKFKLHHYQACCESVYIESIVGDLMDLVGSPLTMVEESVSCGRNEDYDSITWTFYKLATIKGYVDVRWCGISNGYYSESVDFSEIV